MSELQACWMPFKGTLLSSVQLPLGTYKLCRKPSLTPLVPGIQACSLEDQEMYFQVNRMEWQLWQSAAEQKIRDLNVTGGSKILLTHSQSKEPLMVLISNQFDGHQKKVKELGDLLEMAFSQILLPVSSKFFYCVLLFENIIQKLFLSTFCFEFAAIIRERIVNNNW